MLEETPVPDLARVWADLGGTRVTRCRLRRSWATWGIVVAAVLTVALAVAGLAATKDGRSAERTGASSQLLEALATLPVAAEEARSGYARDLFPHWDDADDDGCNTRCEVLADQRRPDGLWLSAWDGYSTDDPDELQVDHVVALAEAWDSGAAGWSAARRDAFADDPANLLAVTASSNLRKGDKDAAEWFPSRAEANCLWASTVVRVKQRWDLSVDHAEAIAIGNLLRTCADGGDH